MQQKSARQRNPRRWGFTLIELLVVISIIAVLLALTAGGVMRARAVGERRTAETVVSKIASALDQQIKAVVDEAATQPVPSLVTAAGGKNVTARVLYQKLTLRAEFPENFIDIKQTQALADGSSTLPGTSGLVFSKLASPTYVQLIRGVTPPHAPTIGDPAKESAICLTAALLKTRRGAAGFNWEEAIGASGVRKEVISGKEFTYFVDPWGMPIRFRRWDFTSPVVNELKQPPYVKAGTTYFDPLDPEGAFFEHRSSWGSYLSTVQAFLGPSYNMALNNNLTPYVYSAGPDRVYDTDDDIYSFRLRRSGQRGD